MRVLRSQEGFAAVSADPRGEPSQTPIYEGGEPHCTVIDESIHAYVVYHDAVLVADDRDRRRNENRAKVTTDSTVHRRRAGADREREPGSLPAPVDRPRRPALRACVGVRGRPSSALTNGAATRTRAARTAASVAATGFLAIAAFQAALALGAPLGRAAWGGAHAGVLPRGLRLASACAAAGWLVAALLVLGRVRYWTLLPFAVFRRGVLVLSPLLAGGAVMNVASSSPWERFFWAPARGGALCGEPDHRMGTDPSGRSRAPSGPPSDDAAGGTCRRPPRLCHRRRARTGAGDPYWERLAQRIAEMTTLAMAVLSR